MRLLVNHMQGKIYLNIIRYKRDRASLQTRASLRMRTSSLDFARM